MILTINVHGIEITEDPERFTFKTARKTVGGDVESHQLSDGRTILMNEDGARLELPLNEKATKLFGSQVLGNVVIVNGKRDLKKVLG